MNEGLIAKRYATALFDWAEELGQSEQLYELMRDRVAEVCAVAQVRERLCNPTLSVADKCAYLDGLLVREGQDEGQGEAQDKPWGEVLPQVWTRFEEFLFAQGREAYFGRIAQAYVNIYRQAKGVAYVVLTTARKADDELKDSVVRLMRQQGVEQVELREVVDPSIEGGFVLGFGDRRMDASIKGQIERIRRTLIEKNRSIV